MADIGMARAVLDHAETYSEVSGWYTVRDFWSAEDILAELQSAERASGRPLTLDAAAIAHFGRIANPTGRHAHH